MGSIRGLLGVWWYRYSRSYWESRAKWNCFDFVVSFASLALMSSFTQLDSGVVSFVRLMRSLRLLSLLQRFEELKVILDGFWQGLESFTYIGLLLGMVFYVYAILGFYEFGDNDPVHFGSLGAAMVSERRFVHGWWVKGDNG
jgi:voltage-gated sodium channel